MPDPYENSEELRRELVRKRFGEEATHRIPPQEKLYERSTEHGKQVENDPQTKERLIKSRFSEPEQRERNLQDLSQQKFFENDTRNDEFRELRHQEVLQERDRLKKEEREKRQEKEKKQEQEPQPSPEERQTVSAGQKPDLATEKTKDQSIEERGQLLAMKLKAEQTQQRAEEQKQQLAQQQALKRGQGH